MPRPSRKAVFSPDFAFPDPGQSAPYRRSSSAEDLHSLHPSHPRSFTDPSSARHRVPSPSNTLPRTPTPPNFSRPDLQSPPSAPLARRPSTLSAFNSPLTSSRSSPNASSAAAAQKFDVKRLLSKPAPLPSPVPSMPSTPTQPTSPPAGPRPVPYSPGDSLPNTPRQRPSTTGSISSSFPLTPKSPTESLSPTSPTPSRRSEWILPRKPVPDFTQDGPSTPTPEAFRLPQRRERPSRGDNSSSSACPSPTASSRSTPSGSPFIGPVMTGRVVALGIPGDSYFTTDPSPTSSKKSSKGLISLARKASGKFTKRKPVGDSTDLEEEPTFQKGDTWAYQKTRRQSKHISIEGLAQFHAAAINMRRTSQMWEQGSSGAGAEKGLDTSLPSADKKPASSRSLWNLVKRLSTSTLKDKRRTSRQESIPAVPPIPSSYQQSQTDSRRSSISDYGVEIPQPQQAIRLIPALAQITKSSSNTSSSPYSTSKAKPVSRPSTTGTGATSHNSHLSSSPKSTSASDSRFFFSPRTSTSSYPSPDDTREVQYILPPDELKRQMTEGYSPSELHSIKTDLQGGNSNSARLGKKIMSRSISSPSASPVSAAPGPMQSLPFPPRRNHHFVTPTLARKRSQSHSTSRRLTKPAPPSETVRSPSSEGVELMSSASVGRRPSLANAPRPRSNSLGSAETQTFAFREMHSHRAKSKDEKDKMWDDLLAKSDKAPGGTLHASLMDDEAHGGGGGGLMSERLRLSDPAVFDADD
jgi:hypothetical protein